MILLLLQNSEGSENFWLKLAVVVIPLITLVLGWLLGRPKTQSEIDKTESETKKNYEEMISNLHKENAAVRKDADERVAAAQNKVVEVSDKLTDWIKRVEKYAADSIEDGEDLAEAHRALEECLETKDKACQKCISRAIAIFSKVERALVGNPAYNDLLLEMSLVRQDLEGK